MTNTASDQNRPDRRTWRARAATTLAVAALGAGLLGACGSASVSGGVTMSCSGDDGRVTVPTGGTVVGDDDVVRVGSSDGRAAVLTWRD